MYTRVLILNQSKGLSKYNIHIPFLSNASDCGNVVVCPFSRYSTDFEPRNILRMNCERGDDV